MAYADEGMSRARVVGLVAVGLVHVLLGYALITGLASRAVKLITEPMKTVNIKEEVKPPEEPPPPPPKDIEIPPFVPPPEVTIQSDAPPPPTISVQNRVVPPPVVTYVAPTPPQPVQPPAPVGETRGAQLDPRSTTTTEDDYPPASQRANEEGVVTVNLSINTAGRVDSCTVAQTSGFTRLDEKTCQIALRRFKGKPALQNGAAVASQKVQRVRWQIPKG